jgi:hypothetical protein
MDILDYARPRQHETGLDGPDLIEDIMGKPRKEQPEAESIFANNPFIEGLFEWMDSPEGQQSIAVRDVLWDLLEGVQVDARACGPRLRRLTALTGLATQPSFATKNSTARSG